MSQQSKRNIILNIILSSLISICGCSNSSENISGIYVSPLLYKSYDCDQLLNEKNRLSKKIHRISRKLDKPYELYIYSFFNKDIRYFKESELASLKGQYDALHETAMENKCIKEEKINLDNVYLGEVDENGNVKNMKKIEDVQ